MQPPLIRAPLPAPKSSALVDTLARTECPALTARRARRAEATGASHDPIVWTRAFGSNVWDADGNRFVDLSSGFGAAAVGHAHPAVVAAVQAQSAVLVHALGDMHPSDVKIELLARLAALAPFDDAHVMLGLGGSDAVTAALKTAMLATRKPGVLAFTGSYHGLEYAPLAACGFSEAFRAPFAAQLNPHVAFAPYPDGEAALDSSLTAIDAALTRGDSPIGAVLVEPVLGRGGVIVPPARFLPELAELCKRHGALLVLDEIMTGVGRAGRFPFASDDAAAHADLICLGKALGGGLPVSACLGRRSVMSAWADAAQGTGGVPLHTGTFFGHPLGCAAALATLHVLERDRLGERAARVGAHCVQRLQRMLGDRACEVRGMGLLIGIDLGTTSRGLGAVQRLLELGYITVPAGADGRVVSITPPLTIDEHLLDGFADALLQVCKEQA